MFLEGRPPVNVGVTNNGDIFGGTQVSFGDVLGDKQVNFFAASISQYRTLSLSYVNLSRRFQCALQGYSQTQFFYGQRRRLLLRSVVRAAHQPRRRDRDAHRARRQRVRHLSVQPLPPRRAVGGHRPARRGVQRSDRCRPQSQQYQQALYGTTGASATARWCRSAPRSSRRRRCSASSVRWPAARCGWPTTSRRRSAALLSRQTLRRRRAPLPAASARTGVLATRIRGFKSIGDFPDFQYFGGNSRAARLRLPAVRRAERRVRQRRAALPADRSGADADRRHRRHPRRVLRRHRRRAGSATSRRQPVHRRSERLQVRDQQRRDLPGADRLQARRARPADRRRPIRDRPADVRC